MITEIKGVMNFDYSETQRLVGESAKQFALQYIAPNVRDWDETQYFPKEVLHKAGEYGFMGIIIPEMYGGAGLSYHEYIRL